MVLVVLVVLVVLLACAAGAVDDACAADADTAEHKLKTTRGLHLKVKDPRYSTS